MASGNLSERDESCDGINPDSGMPCVLGEHRGFHEDERGQQWLDD